jgi:hypothetical protein
VCFSEIRVHSDRRGCRVGAMKLWLRGPRAATGLFSRLARILVRGTARYFCLLNSLCHVQVREFLKKCGLLVH